MVTRAAKPPPRSRTGGRSARVVHDVLEATLEELGRVGYVALTFEGVAARAAVNRTTIYRRWPTKLELVHAALLDGHDALMRDLPDTGALRSDLLALARHRLATMSLPRARAIAAAIISEPPDSELVKSTEVLRERARESVRQVVKRAVARGEIPARTDADLIQQPLFAVLFAGAILRRELPDESYLTRLIDALVVGASHDAQRAHPTSSSSSSRRRRLSA